SLFILSVCVCVCVCVYLLVDGAVTVPACHCFQHAAQEATVAPRLILRAARHRVDDVRKHLRERERWREREREIQRERERETERDGESERPQVLFKSAQNYSTATVYVCFCLYVHVQ